MLQFACKARWVCMVLLTLLVSFQASAKVARRILIPSQQYYWLNTAQKNAYIDQVRTQFQKLEEAKLKSTPVASFSLWMQNAFAGPGRCLIGGVDQPVIGGKCSSRGNECEGQPDSFKCGAIFGSVCIPRTPVGYISSRCRIEAQKSAPVTEENFESYSLEAESLFAKHCTEDKSASIPCAQFKRQMDASRSKFVKASDQNAENAKSKPIPVKAADASPPPAVTNKPAPTTPAPSAPASAPPKPAAAMGPCLDINPDASGCVEGSWAIGKNEMYKACKDKKQPSVQCGEYEVLSCKHGRYEKGIRSKDMALYADARKGQFLEEAKKQGIDIPLVELEKMIKSGENIYPQGNADSKDQMASFAEAFNRDHNFCADISALKDRRGENSRCQVQNQRFPAQNISLKDLSEIAQKNYNDLSQALNRCQQKKEPLINAVAMEQTCQGEKCQGAEASGFPLAFQADDKGGGVLEFVDAKGDRYGLQVFGGANGVLKVKNPEGELVDLKSLQKVAACRVMLTAPVSKEYKDVAECEALMQLWTKATTAKAAAPSSPVPSTPHSAK